jgi:hypothetical protein
MPDKLCNLCHVLRSINHTFRHPNNAGELRMLRWNSRKLDVLLAVLLFATATILLAHTAPNFDPTGHSSGTTKSQMTPPCILSQSPICESYQDYLRIAKLPLPRPRLPLQHAGGRFSRYGSLAHFPSAYRELQLPSGAHSSHDSQFTMR